MTSVPDSLSSTIPEVTATDIAETERVLGVSFDATRRDVLLSNASFDVQACPGSGKTTLLVAKLAILAGKWPHARRGICVLSHTNVARREIEEKLGGTAAGQRLLSYPHFVGTIHGFVNEFLALPLLRSEGYCVRLIDDEASGEHCRRLLYSVRAHSTAKQFLAQKEQHNPDKTICSLRYEGANLTLSCAAGRLPCGPASPSYRSLSEIKAAAVKGGLWRFDDMFAWAERLLAKCPKAAEFVRWRFPAVFIDEMQDTSELQSRVLSGVFTVCDCIIRQRFGDTNQAIYEDGPSAAVTDPFPSSDHRSIPNSQRFGMCIAAKAEPLAPVPPKPSLVGEGPSATRFPVPVDASAIAHTVFLFADDTIRQVLPAYGALLLRAFPDEVVASDRFLARAIGRVGKSDPDDSKIPKNLGDYWPDYEPRAAKLEPRPETLADHVHLAQRRRAGTVDCAESVRTATRGILRVVEVVAPDLVSAGVQVARWLSDSIQDDDSALRSLRQLLWRWCVDLVAATEADWPEMVKALRCSLRPIIGEQWNNEADAFCRWSVEFQGRDPATELETNTAPNIYRYAEGSRSVDIEVGTIHSAKGQTHTATLVLETFLWDHDMEDLSPWVLGQKRGVQGKEGVRRPDRLRMIYTAMTRPSHLLCLAMRRGPLEAGGGLAENAKRLRELGWQVIDL